METLLTMFLVLVIFRTAVDKVGQVSNQAGEEGEERHNVPSAMVD